MSTHYQYKCCICGFIQSANRQAQHRELPDCEKCNSTPRVRGLIYAVLRHIYNDTSVDFVTQTEQRHISGIGISDGINVAELLGSKFSYINTAFHTEPFLNICDAASIAQYRDLSFIICSEVIEHTELTPVAVLPNLRQMLRPGGIVVLTTPTVQMSNTIEWYSGAVSVEVERLDEQFIVKWRNRRGVEYVDTNPAFHGGPGETLEMRMISHLELTHAAKQVGFNVETLEFDLNNGYYWPHFRHESFVMIDARVIILERNS